MVVGEIHESISHAPPPCLVVISRGLIWQGARVSTWCQLIGLSGYDSQV